MLRVLSRRLRVSCSRGSLAPFSSLRIFNAGKIISPDTKGKTIEEYEDSEIIVKDGKIVAIVPKDGPALGDCDENFDAQGALITPGFVDAHTHLFPPIDRADEFALRSVKSYQEIAAEGGGILSSVKAIRSATMEDIVEANKPLLAQFFAQGTTTVEVKSGYGLSLDDELKCLRAIQELQRNFADKLTIVPTFMGAHAIPKEYKEKKQEYIDLICQVMIPEVAKQKLATYCDVFCENGYFDASESEQILLTAKQHGLRVRLHADEFVDSGGALLAAKLNADSADHLMAVSDAGIEAMAKTEVIPIILPGTTIFLGKSHSFAPMKKMYQAGCRVAISTDFNPGSSVFQSLPHMMQLCMAHGKLTLQEVLLGTTYNAAVSLNLRDTVGTLQPGAKADMVLWNLQSASQIPYYGSDSQHRITSIVKNGRVFQNPREHIVYKMQKRGLSTATVSSNATKVAQALTSRVKISSKNQISAIDESISLTTPFTLDPTVDHAPKRIVNLTEEEKEIAIVNALKYFDPSLHAKMRPICEHELQTYGHIYFYPLTPPVHLQAIPFNAIPAKLASSRAMIHMILNNLDPAVAQFPQELITYGGNGAVFSNWAQFYLTMNFLINMNENQCLSMVSGHPQGLFPKIPGSPAPAAVITNGMMVGQYNTTECLNKLYAMSVTMYGQMTAGSWMYIGPQGIVHGTTLTLAQAMAMQRDSNKSKIFLTSGLGGMSGAQPKAATINKTICIVAEINEKALKKRHAQGWLDEYYSSIDEVLDRAKLAQAKNESVSIGYLGNVVDLWEKLASTPKDQRPVVQVGSDQTSLHNPYNGGYYPVGMSFEEANKMMIEDPTSFKKAVQKSLLRHMSAIEKLIDTDNLFFFDYGNAFLLECTNAGWKNTKNIQSYVECIMGPEFFDYGFGPYRWVCTSGDAAELLVTDKIAASVLRDQLAEGNSEIKSQLDANLTWIESAMENNLVVGSQARILYSDTEGRIECAVRMNAAVRNGELKSPVVIGRDHHDVSGTDSPWRETANIRDGSNITADMSMQNVIGDAMRGATWVSIHNGGGTGWGQASNGGFGLVLDGSPEAEQRARYMIFFDVANGLTRRARAGNPHAISTIRRLAKKYQDFQPFLADV